MENGSESFLGGTRAGVGAECYDEATFDTMFSGVSLLSLLGASDEANTVLTTMPPPLFGDFAIPPLDYSPPQSQPPPPPPPTPQPPLTHFPAMFSFYNGTASGSLMFPKAEPLGFEDLSVPTNNLPDLLSLEGTITDHDSPFRPLLLHQKRARVDSASRYRVPTAVLSHQALNSLEVTRRRRLPLIPSYTPPPRPSSSITAAAVASSSPPMIPRGSELARKRRQKLSDKTRCLQKLLPWDKKMDMATMLEEAYKYVKFLQAQLTALKAMPNNCPGADVSVMQSLNGFTDLDDEFAGLERLTRNQLLQVLVNSPAVQTKIYSQGCCVYSVEQMGVLENVTAMRRRRTGSNPLPPLPFSSF
ncbi:Basic helix-loop-helix transcription factor [Parasponia andersonii]|uniref:Basic helix-loop-helix transcription factor n=1 Tax=Parasponia andersonii TaxID=3476 RepID=A0A2P5BIA6_PARAD|nr:Basic helix-loop-helix transcription factor [Parasponia andersonii]